MFPFSFVSFFILSIQKVIFFFHMSFLNVVSLFSSLLFPSVLFFFSVISSLRFDLTSSYFFIPFILPCRAFFLPIPLTLPYFSFSLPPVCVFFLLISVSLPGFLLFHSQLATSPLIILSLLLTFLFHFQPSHFLFYPSLLLISTCIILHFVSLVLISLPNLSLAYLHPSYIPSSLLALFHFHPSDLLFSALSFLLSTISLLYISVSPFNSLYFTFYPLLSSHQTPFALFSYSFFP